MTVDLTVANAAMRLDPGLLVPVGSEVFYLTGETEHLHRGQILQYDLLGRLYGGIPEDNVNNAVLVCLASGAAPRVILERWVFRRLVREIVRLPDDCPRIAEWQRVISLLGASSR